MLNLDNINHIPDSNVNPDFKFWRSELDKIQDCFLGQKRVKDRTVKYLPKTRAMTRNTRDGERIYSDYLLRADYRNIAQNLSSEIFGLLNLEDSLLLTESTFLKDLSLNMDLNGLDIQDLYQEINKEQLKFGRVGYLVEVSEGGETFVKKYNADKIINWGERDGKLQFVVLDESVQVPNNAGHWELLTSYRVLRLHNNTYQSYHVNDLSKVNLQGEMRFFEGEKYETEMVIEPAVQGKTLDRIPFVFINWDSVASDMSTPFILPACDFSLSLYRLDADYKQYLFNMSQDTFFAFGITEEEASRITLGTGASIISESSDAKCGFIGINGTGISSLKQAIEDLKAETNNLGITLQEGANESGKALSIRMTAKTSTLNKIAKSASDGIFEILRLMQEWAGNTDEFEFVANYQFSEDVIVTQDLTNLINAKNMGFPLSSESLHRFAREKGYTELSFNEENELINNSI